MAVGDAPIGDGASDDEEERLDPLGEFCGEGEGVDTWDSGMGVGDGGKGKC